MCPPGGRYFGFTNAVENYKNIGSITNFVGFRIPLIASATHIE